MDIDVQAIIPPASGDPIGKALYAIAQSMHSAKDLATGEAAVDQIAELLDMRLPCWVPDISYPYYCSRQDEYARKHGWPEEMMQFWWDHHAALKMPFYVRCRFENLPFVSSLGQPQQQSATKLSQECRHISKLLYGLGVRTMVTVPLHLPKGRVAMMTWAGSRDKAEMKNVIGGIMGYLLAIGHNFMRIYDTEIGTPKESSEQQARLTPREWDCLRTLAQGFRVAEVANVTGISKATVRSHLDNVVLKFGCKNRVQAVAMAAQLGLLGPVGL
jgi:DNA-binding CsgD family transcriptional regulator